METPVILSAARTPVGSFQGQFANTPAPRLGAAAIDAAVTRSGLKKEDIKECVMGEVLTAGVGQAPARQAAIYAGLPQHVECMTINKVCGSGLKAVALGTDTIRLGLADVVVAGGQESMSLAPYVLEKARSGFRMGHGELTDSMIKDGLWDPYGNVHMGNCAELCAREFHFTREAQDQFAIESYKRAQRSIADGVFAKEIVGVEVSVGKENTVVTTDEEPGKAKFDKIPGLKPAFEKDGTITAANASKINDGAAALVLSSESFAKSKNIRPMAKILSYASFAQDPKWFTTAPAGAVKKALAQATLKTSDIDLWEINEAFANVTMAAIKELQLDASRVNIHGGSIAIGHPIGASGARLLTTLLYALEKHGLKRGLATLCIGGGEGIALIVERT